MNDRARWLLSGCFVLGVLVSIMDIVFPGTRAIICAPFEELREYSVKEK